MKPSRILALLAVAGVLWLGAEWRWDVTFREGVWLACLVSRQEVLQRVALRELRDHPTRRTAIALVLFTDLKQLRPKDPDEAARAKYDRGLELAEEAVESLCVITGEAFGTWYKEEAGGHSWGSPLGDRWPRVLGAINGWALATFGTEEAGELAQFAGLWPVLPEPEPEPEAGA